MSPRDRWLLYDPYCAQFKCYHEEETEMNENEELPVTEAELARVHDRNCSVFQGGCCDCVALIPTPETDAATHDDWSGGAEATEPEVSRKLERELAAARAAIKVARDAMKRADDRLHQICGAYMALAHNEPEKVLFDAIKEMGPDMTAVSAALTQLNTHTHE